MDKEQQIKEVSETYEDIKKGLEIGTERFLKNMKNVLEDVLKGRRKSAGGFYGNTHNNISWKAYR